MLDRVFCKDLIVKMNQRDFVYPEYTNHLEADQNVNNFLNVWRLWEEDTPKRINKIFELEVKSGQFNYDRLEMRVVKNIDEMKALTELINENFDKIINLQKTLLDTSDEKYPRISFESIFDHIIII